MLEILEGNVQVCTGMWELKCGITTNSRWATCTTQAILAPALTACMRVFAGICACKRGYSRMQVARPTSLAWSLIHVDLLVWHAVQEYANIIHLMNVEVYIWETANT